MFSSILSCSTPHAPPHPPFPPLVPPLPFPPTPSTIAPHRNMHMHAMHPHTPPPGALENNPTPLPFFPFTLFRIPSLPVYPPPTFLPLTHSHHLPPSVILPPGEGGDSVGGQGWSLWGRRGRWGRQEGWRGGGRRWPPHWVLPGVQGWRGAAMLWHLPLLLPHPLPQPSSPWNPQWRMDLPPLQGEWCAPLHTSLRMHVLMWVCVGMQIQSCARPQYLRETIAAF